MKPEARVPAPAAHRDQVREARHVGRVPHRRPGALALAVVACSGGRADVARADAVVRRERGRLRAGQTELLGHVGDPRRPRRRSRPGFAVRSKPGGAPPWPALDEATPDGVDRTLDAAARDGETGSSVLQFRGDTGS
jgi:hypothetical protein